MIRIRPKNANTWWIFINGLTKILYISFKKGVIITAMDRDK